MSISYDLFKKNYFSTDLRGLISVIYNKRQDLLWMKWNRIEQIFTECRGFEVDRLLEEGFKNGGLHAKFTIEVNKMKKLL